ncbi:8628_t:CDS:2, partial [Scutellospora calospora]
KNKLLKDKEEIIDDFNNRMFYYSDFFKKSFDIAEERYQQEKLFSTFFEKVNIEENIKENIIEEKNI